MEMAGRMARVEKRVDHQSGAITEINAIQRIFNDAQKDINAAQKDISAALLDFNETQSKIIKEQQDAEEAMNLRIKNDEKRTEKTINNSNNISMAAIGLCCLLFFIVGSLLFCFKRRLRMAKESQLFSKL